ncbi:glycosyltransferase family 2 protein [Candidatus Dependentiae bacterium]|nr:glycosyltransferase family 2 protein [Candidatus Dependentiae bacterium]
MNKTAIIKTALPLFIVLIVSVFSCIQTDQSCAQKELPMVVVSCSYNNAPWAEKSLDSIFMQKYDNYRVIYVDDASQDGTAEIVQAYIEKHNLQDKVTLIKNDQRRRKMHNIYNVYHTCEDHEIIVQLDGDDWFAHDEVLAYLNQAYLNNDIWLTYGTHENVPKSNIGAKSSAIPLNLVKNRTFREKFRYMPTRSFYAWLFKSIKLEDTLCTNVQGFEGKFFPVLNDGVMMWAMLEMAHYRFKYLKKTSYIANRKNPIIGRKVDRTLYKQVRVELNKIQEPLYPVVSTPSMDRLVPCEQAKADCVMLFENSYYDLYHSIRALQENVKNLGNIIVLYQTKKSRADIVCQELKEKYPDITFVKINDEGGCTAAVSALKSLSNDYILLANDRCKLTEPLDCTYCIYELERTFAYGFYTSVSPSLCRRNRVPCQYIVDDLYAWKFACDKENKLSIHNFDMTLYRTQDLITSLEKGRCTTLSKVRQTWQSVLVGMHQVGLF